MVEPRGAADVAWRSPDRRRCVAKTAPEIAENPLVFRDAETQARLSGYPDLAPADERQMNERFAQISGG